MSSVDEYVEKAEKQAKNREYNRVRALQALARQRASEGV